MRRISGKLTGSTMLLTLALGCNPEQSVRPRSPAFEANTMPAPTLVLHVVAPQATDPAIDQGLDDHYVWIDTTARSNHKLFVFLPGTGQNPSIFQLVQQEAARLGYHVIGLMYPTGGGLAKACPTTPDPSACYENARLEIIDGIDRVAFLNVSVANSIDNRLTKLLQYLALQYPDEGWDRFLLRDKPKWTQMLVTDLLPRPNGFVGTNAHGSPSNDLNTPLGSDGTPLLRDAWRYLLTARGAGQEDAELDDIASGGDR